MAKPKTCANPACLIGFTPPGRGTWRYCSSQCWHEVDRTKARQSPFVEPSEVEKAEDAVNTAIVALEEHLRGMDGVDSTIDEARTLQLLTEDVVGAMVLRDRFKGRPWQYFRDHLECSEHTVRKRYDLPGGGTRRLRG